MPVEIKELVIRAVVSPATPDRAEPAGKVGGDGAAADAPGVVNQDAVVAAAVKEVLRILRAAKER